MVALWRARAAVPGRAEIGAGLQGPLRQLRTAWVAGVQRQLSDIGRDVHHQPMPEAAAGRRVRVVAGDGEALRSCWRFRPCEVRRLVAAGAAEAEIGGQNVRLPEIIAVLEAVAFDRERHASLPQGQRIQFVAQSRPT